VLSNGPLFSSESKRDGIENTQMELTEEGDQLSYSVYSRSMKRTETQMKMPSGAFFEESGDERERESGEREGSRRRAPPPSLSQTRALRVAQRHQNKEQDPEEEQQPTNISSSGRGLPTALIEDEDEEVDDIAPLPSPALTQASRKERSLVSTSMSQGQRQQVIGKHQLHHLLLSRRSKGIFQVSEKYEDSSDCDH
jgi:hypothetical protein